jgi:hypothetical protein
MDRDGDNKDRVDATSQTKSERRRRREERKNDQYDDP